ncbi:lamin tail domain-containing protein [Lutibacter sp.]|uniref:lamin tail domain-containing protein n=1 Tax=Lutibacter sp. TaxID=1925666 RepID=UPI0034A022D2
MKRFYFLVVTIFMVTLSFGQTDVFINEIHYDNNGAVSNEGVEIAGPSGTDLNGWTIEFYNGNNSMVYETIILSGIIPIEENSRGTLWFLQEGIQDGPDGIALIDGLGNVIQFLSYEGIFTAADGTANGMLSTDIGVSEDNSVLVGESIQLTGTGTYYNDFSWASAATATEGLKNNSQTFSTAPAIISNNYLVSDLDYEVGSGPSIEGVFVVSGANLTADISINAPSNFEISETSGGFFSASVTLLKGAGTTISPTTIYVRLKSGLSIGSYNQNVICSSADAVSKSSLLSGIVSPNVGSIIITEIMQDPNAVGDAAGEYFEVYNTTASDIDMQGWVISEVGLESHTIASSVIVPANGYAVFARDADTLLNGGFTVDYQFTGFSLANTNDEIILTSGATEIDRVVYSDILGYPLIAGKSMELSLGAYDSVANNAGSNWGVATTTYGDGDFGTPGAENIFTLSVVKNQIKDFVMYPNPVSNGVLFMTSNNNTNKQVEIYALTGQQVFSKKLLTQEHLNVSKLNKGIYLIRIEEEGKVATRKLVVN